MPLPSQPDLVNALLEILRKSQSPVDLRRQTELVAQLLRISPEDAAEPHDAGRTKLAYRLAWARTQLKGMNLLENPEPGVWILTDAGRTKGRLTADDFRESQRRLDTAESAGTGIEQEDVEAQIVKPFDPTLIRVESKPATLGQLISRIKHNEIDLAPAFQRKAGIWKDVAQSRLIESILVRIPIPAFYFDASNEDRWVVVDGLQRLTTLRRFVIDQELKLTGLEFLDGMDGRSFDQLPRSLQRRIDETGTTIFLIEKNTPPNVKFNIFKRINTGGLPLSAQEIRHALNQGEVTAVLSDLASSVEFGLATDYGIRDDRMADRECVLRFLAFSIHPATEYKSTDFDGFLSESMAEINRLSRVEIDLLKSDFKQAMNVAHALFGRDAFRKPFRLSGRRMPINKALFEAWAVNLGKLKRQDVPRVLSKKAEIESEFFALCNDPDFFASITQSTGDPVRVRRRFGSVAMILDIATEL